MIHILSWGSDSPGRPRRGGVWDTNVGDWPVTQPGHGGLSVVAFSGSSQSPPSRTAQGSGLQDHQFRQRNRRLPFLGLLSPVMPVHRARLWQVVRVSIWSEPRTRSQLCPAWRPGGFPGRPGEMRAYGTGLASWMYGAFVNCAVTSGALAHWAPDFRANVTSISMPPSGRARGVRAAPWASAMARTTAS